MHSFDYCELAHEYCLRAGKNAARYLVINFCASSPPILHILISMLPYPVGITAFYCGGSSSGLSVM